MGDTDQPTNQRLAHERTSLARLRTVMAATRSLMAWVRTAISMIAFGFTIYRFLQDSPDALEPHRARDVGLFLIAWGDLAILFGCLEYWNFAREMRRDHGIAVRRFPLIVASVIGAMGLALLIGVLLEAV